MSGFDIWDPTLNVKQNYFLEASAGTGKTFTIENLVVRLLEEGMAIGKILVVTFTRAATLELKARIRAHLEKKQLKKPLAAFDEAQIFTIHSFCFHTLKEQALEADFPISQEEESASEEALKRILQDFLRSELTPEEISARQLEKVLKKEIVEELQKPFEEGRRSFQQIAEEIEAEVKALYLKEEVIKELISAASSFSGMCNKQRQLKEDVIADIERCRSLLEGKKEDFIDLPLAKMVPENLLKGKSYPPFLQPLHAKLIPLLAEISDREKILDRLRGRAQRFLTSVCEKEDLFFYDDLLKQMHKNVFNPTFAAKVRAEYEAVLIDEFQDTDALQWEIFSTLFLHHVPLYLVGDPKQSIYRFRGADLYTYMKAKEAFETHVTLVRNFRSDPVLIEGLNSLFRRVPHLMKLPKIGQTLQLPPIEAALPATEKGKWMFCQAEEENAYFSYCLHEIERLHDEEQIPYAECALLVKDRYQAQRFLAQCPLPCATKKNESLLDSDALAVLEDLLVAVDNPRERNALVKALGGPLFNLSLEVLAEGFEEFVEAFYRYHALFETKGVMVFFKTVIKESCCESETLYLDMLQLVEVLAEQTATTQEALLCLQKWKQENRERDFLRARAKSQGDAIQVLSMHVSKGLEFEAVFPVGLMAPVDLEEEEEQSEKMRQLYVAVTRAKKRLYFPVTQQENTMGYFFLHQVLAGETMEAFVRNNPCFDLVKCEKKTFFYSPKAEIKHEEEPSFVAVSFPPCALYSYSSLAEKKEIEHKSPPPSTQIPAGTETGLMLHRIFEKLDFTKKGEELTHFVASQLKGAHLEPWLHPIVELVQQACHFPLLKRFSLATVDPHKIIREMEFLYPSQDPAGYIKGFIDLFFEHEGRYYCLDWKSNYLPHYAEVDLKEAIAFHDYTLQAKLYQNAARRYLKLFDLEERFQGIFYLFLRGLNGETQEGVYFFEATHE